VSRMTRGLVVRSRIDVPPIRTSLIGIPLEKSRKKASQLQVVRRVLLSRLTSTDYWSPPSKPTHSSHLKSSFLQSHREPTLQHPLLHSQSTATQISRPSALLLLHLSSLSKQPSLPIYSPSTSFPGPTSGKSTHHLQSSTASPERVRSDRWACSECRGIERALLPGRGRDEGGRRLRRGDW